MRPMLVIYTLIAAVAILIPTLALARTKLIDLKPGASAKATMIGERIAEVREKGGTVHIVYMHGMRANGAGHSAELRDAIASRFRGEIVRLDRTRVDLGERPRSASIVGREVWNVPDSGASDQRWLASRPFVDRYAGSIGKGLVIIDELNWWPLLLPLKCQFLVVPEHDLSGADKEHLRLCAQGPLEGRKRDVAKGDANDAYYPWISPADAEALIRKRPASGGAALANRWLKQQILNWGVADAPIVLGTMQPLIRKGIDAAFAGLAAGERGPTVHRIAVTESLGSFVLLDSMKLSQSKAAEFVGESADLFFIANQFALLELARINFDEGASLAPNGGASVLGVLAREARPAAIPTPRQVVAISDPSDVLTHVVPDVNGVDVVNIVAPVSGRWKLFTRPDKAHRGALRDRAVMDMLLRAKKPRS